MDFDAKSPIISIGSKTMSITGVIGVIALLGLLGFKLQKFSIAQGSFEEKMLEGRLEREFRHRQQFLLDMHTFQLVMLAAIWLSLNYIMNVNRDRATH